MNELYLYPTGNGWRAAIGLEECGLPYRVHRVDIARGEQHDPTFRALNPRGKLPVLVDPDGPGGVPITIVESGAILLYCCERAGRFIPADPARRMAALQWLFHGVSDAGEPISGLFRLARLPDPEPALAFMRGRLDGVLAAFDAHLADSRYLVGDEVTIADLACYTVAAQGRDFVDIAGRPHLQRWLAELGERPAIARAMQVGR